MNESQALAIVGIAAVTPVGLSAAQTCASIRASLSGMAKVVPRQAPLTALHGARVPARASLRGSEFEWLVNLADRAIRESLSGLHARPRTTALLLCVPEPHREHPAFQASSPSDLLLSVQSRLGHRFGMTRLFHQGHAAAFDALSAAAAMLAEGMETCLVCGVDSLLNDGDIERLDRQGRLHDDDNPQGLVPGEGSACIALARAADARPAVAHLIGWGCAEEANTVLGDDESSGDGLRASLQRAVAAAGVPESCVVARVSDMNGERYRAWESCLAATRFYRTRRERLPVLLPAAYVGDAGCAAGPLSLVVAANAMAKGYAEGPVYCCEGSSEAGLRGAALVRNAPSARVPPFRSRSVPETVAPSSRVIRTIVERHVDDVGSLRRTRAWNVGGYRIGLDGLSRIDERIDAHLDALTIAGPAGWNAAQQRFGAWDREGEFAAYVLAIESGDDERLRRCFAFAEATPDGIAALARAFGWVSPLHLKGLVRDLLAHDAAPRRELALSICARHQVDPGRALTDSLQHEGNSVAFRVAGELGRVDVLSRCLSELATSGERERAWPAWCAVMLGDRGKALDALVGMAASPGLLQEDMFEVALRASSMEANRAQLRRIAGSGREATSVLVHAAGVSGDIRYIEWLLELMKTPRFAQASGESLRLITGADLFTQGLVAEGSRPRQASPNDDPDDPRVSSLVDSDLPWPDPAKCAVWWTNNRHAFHEDERYFLGRRLSREWCVEVLKNGLQKHRLAAAQYLTLMNPGTPLFDTHAPAWRQLRRLGRAG
jgi:uncharacterized protein (TIGR02270 family)